MRWSERLRFPLPALTGGVSFHLENFLSLPVCLCIAHWMANREYKHGFAAVLLWMLLIELFRKKVEAMVPP